MTATERHPTSIQLWPGGKTLYYSGDPHGPDLRTHTGYADTEGTPAGAEDAKALRIELRAKQYLDNEILCCDSALVDAMLSASSSGELSGDLAEAFSWEQVENLRLDPFEWDLERCKAFLEDNGHDLPDPNPYECDPVNMTGRVALALDSETYMPVGMDNLTAEYHRLLNEGLIDGFEDCIDSFREAVRDHADDAEVMQWFRITSWFCSRLREAGEVVLDNGMGQWFGRQACGQSLIMDGTLQRVAATQES